MELDLYLTDSKPIVKDGREYVAVVLEGIITPEEYRNLTDKSELWKIKVKVEQG